MRADEFLPAVSAVIVTHESGNLAWAAKQSFEAAFAGLPVEAIVVDNASHAPDFPPGSLAIRNDRNLGFGAACNVGASAARAPILLFLNPDARLGAGRWDEVLAHFERNPGVGAIGVRRFDPGGDPVPEEIPAAMTLGRVLRDVVVAGLPRRGRRPAGAGPAFEAACWLPASCLFVRSEVLAQVGGFDESFFLFFEDVDLCERIRRARYDVVFARVAEAMHPEAGHEKYHDRVRLGHYYAGLVTYFAKWRPRVLPLVRAFALARITARVLYWTYARLRGDIDGGGLRERLAGYRVAARAVLGAGTRRESGGDPTRAGVNRA